MPRFHTQYFIITVILFVIEILIALYVNDSFIRPYLGDLLVVILIYCAIRAFFDTPVVATAIGVLAFSFLVELLQYFNIISVLGLQHNRLARVVIGTSFTREDLIAYAAGIVIVLLVEKNTRRSTG